jgi:alkylation response protein AidB-like acyl-CoA dehydrogenase
VGGYRSEFISWLDRQWDEERSLLEWRRALVLSGWAVPSWPIRWHGRDLPAAADSDVAKIISERGAVGTPIGVGFALAAPTLLAHASDELREELLRPTLTGESSWCQLFSEPGAGSDLAGVTSAALTNDDGSWCVNGQKVWTTSAHKAKFGLLLARTNWDASKHKGLSIFVVDMRSPGVEVRPLRQMNEHSSFNEVFLTDVRVPAHRLVGDLGNGWAIAQTTLAYERRFNAMKRPRHPPGSSRIHDEARRERDEFLQPYSWYPQRAGRPDLAVPHAQTRGVSANAVVRQEIARLYSIQQVSAWTTDRATASRKLGKPPGPEGSIGKLALSEMARQAGRVHSMIAGAHGLIVDKDDRLSRTVAEILTSIPAQSIAGGTDEIQRNIIGERVLGLPREPSGDREKPFLATRQAIIPDFAAPPAS